MGAFAGRERVLGGMGRTPRRCGGRRLGYHSGRRSKRAIGSPRGSCWPQLDDLGSAGAVGRGCRFRRPGRGRGCARRRPCRRQRPPTCAARKNCRRTAISAARRPNSVTPLCCRTGRRERRATSNLVTAKAIADERAAQLAQTEIRAPTDGIVSKRTATLGNVVSVGQELFRLIRDGRVELRAEVPEMDLHAPRGQDEPEDDRP